MNATTTTAEQAIAALAAGHHGLFTVEHARHAGLTRKRLRYHREIGTYELLAPGVYRVAGAPTSFRQELLAACWAGGPLCVASHRAAAALHGLDGFRVGRRVWDPRRGLLTLPAEVSVPRPRNRFAPVLVHLSRDLSEVDVGEVDAVPCTSVARTIVDLAAIVHPRRLEEALDGAERDGLTDRHAVRARLDALRRKGRPGVRVLDDILLRRGAETVPESVLERRFVRLLERYGIPQPARQVEVARHGGRTARVDFAYRDARVAIELDGHGAHSTRRDRQHDAERGNDVVLDGWTLLRFTYEDVLERETHVVRTVTRAVAAAAPLASGAR